MGQKHTRFRYSRTPFPLRDIRKNPRSMYASEPQTMAQFLLKIEKFSHIMGPTPILEIARIYGLRPRLWLLEGLKVFGFAIMKPSFSLTNVKAITIPAICSVNNYGLQRTIPQPLY